MEIQRTSILFIFTFALLLCVSCDHKHDQAMFTRLQQWDVLLEQQPQTAKDSLATLRVNELSLADRAYFGLLKTISDDKTYSDFTSDSLINSVASYFNRYKKGSDNHIRSLVYRAIVRYRMGIMDSTVFTPLKEGEQLYLKQKQPNSNTGYMLYYYLGDLLSSNNEFSAADIYFNKALQLAKQKNDSVHVFDAYLALFWNEMSQKKYDSGKLYLDSLDEMANLLPDQQYRLLNSQSIYYEIKKDFEKELYYEKAKLHLVHLLKEPIHLFRLYYAISDAYSHNNLLDSANQYALLAITHIPDSSYKLNYLLYENAAGIAQKQQNFPVALEYKQKAFEEYKKSIDNRLNTQIVEIEKRYNLSESENKALKAERKSQIWLLLMIVVAFIVVLFVLYMLKQRTIAKLRERESAEKILRMKAEEKETKEKTLRLQAEKKQMEIQATRQQKMMEVSAQFLSEYAVLHEKPAKWQIR